MIFIKIPSICNTNRSIDIRVQCSLSIQGCELILQTFLDRFDLKINGMIFIFKSILLNNIKP